MKLTIYQIEKNYIQLAEELIDNGGELTPELSEALAITEEQLQNKAVAYSFVIKEMDGEVEIIENEIKRLQAMKKARENASERLKSNIKQAMQLFNIEEIKTPLVKINFRKSKSVSVDDVNALPKEYKTVTVEETANKKEIKAVLENGGTIIGCRIVENKNLQIR